MARVPATLAFLFPARLVRALSYLGGGMSKEEGVATAAVVSGVVVKSGPPVVVSTMTLAGYSLNDWVLVATLVWIAVQMGWFIWSNIIRPRLARGGGK